MSYDLNLPRGNSNSNSNLIVDREDDVFVFVNITAVSRHSSSRGAINCRGAISAQL